MPAERDGSHDHARRADAALRAVVLDEGALQRMTAAKPFDGRDPRAVGVGERDQARVHRRAVEEHGAGAAFAFAASFLRAGQAAILAQDIEQALQRMRVDAAHRAVQRDAHAISFSGVAGISRTS